MSALHAKGLEQKREVVDKRRSKGSLQLHHKTFLSVMDCAALRCFEQVNSSDHV